MLGRAKYPLLLLGALALALSSCGGGGGGGGGDSGPPGPLFIGAELNSFPPGGVPPGLTSNAFVAVFDANDNSVASASVTMNGVALAYNADDGGYEGNVVVAPGGAVSLSVTVGGSTYSASATQFTSYPTISAPASGAFDQHVANLMTWSGGSPTSGATEYVLGVLDAGNPDSPLIWPPDHFLQEIPAGTTSFLLPAAEIPGGNRLLIAGISLDTAIPNAASGSALSVSGFNYVPITVNGMQITQHFLPDISVDAVAWSDTESQFVAVGENGTILTSPDGTAWTTRRSGTSEFLNGIVWSGTQFVVVGNAAGAGVVLTSPDGTSWTSRAPGTSSSLFSVTWSGTLFAAGGIDTIVTSPDGINWTPHSTSNTCCKSINALASSGSTFVAALASQILTSPDGAVWTPQTFGASDLEGATWSGSQFVVVGSSVGICCSDLILTSPDGGTWTTQLSTGNSFPRAVAWTGSQFVAAGGPGNVGTILTSPDGATWTQQGAGTNIPLKGVAASPSTTVMVGGGTILTSP